MFKTLAVIFVLAFILSACTKQPDLAHASYRNVNATIVRDNPNIVGSCGWMIQLKYGNYFPDNLDTASLHSGQKVVIDYTLTGGSGAAVILLFLTRRSFISIV